MKMKAYWLASIALLFTVELQAAPFKHLHHEITTQKILTHVQFLSGDSLEGRLTGSPGEKLATQYIADFFAQLGLEPAGDKKTYFQEFNFVTGVSLGENNSFVLTNQQGVKKELKLNQEWRPLDFSDSNFFETNELVFAGYGITAPALGTLPAYDSYRGLNVNNKWVIVFSSMPVKNSAPLRQQLAPYASLRYKAFTAKTQGAKGIIFVSDELVSLSSHTSLSGSGITALSVKSKVIDALIQPQNSLKKLKNSLDTGHLSVSPTVVYIGIKGRTELNKTVQRGRNVLATLRLTSQVSPILIVGAHVDHLGRGQLSGSRKTKAEEGMIHPGADDNASGVSSMLAAAEKLSALKAQGLLHGTKNIVFAAWSGEEYGVLGSSHFVTQLQKNTAPKPLHDTIDAVINLDMVGHLREHLVLQGIGSSADWSRIIHQIKKTQSLSVLTQEDPYLPTDSTAFYLQGVPALNFFTGAHDTYHTPRDTPDTLNYEGIKKVSELLLESILLLEKHSGSISYQKVERTNEPVERDFKIYLGTIPDYATPDHSGVRLSGVAKNSPAERSGLQHGDVIIELAGKKIHDIYDYTYVLNTLQVGKPVPLIVLRKKAKVTLVITAQYRR